MKDFINKLYRNHSLIYKGLLFICTTILIVYLFPKTGKFKYNFERGKPWQSENLYAPFNFAIKKSNEEIAIEKKTISDHSTLFFTVDSAIENEVNNLFESSFKIAFSDSIPKLKRNILFKAGEKIINELYVFGVLSENYNFPENKTVIILEDRIEKHTTKFADLIDQEEVSSIINKVLIEEKLSTYKTEFTSLFFDLIQPNLTYDKSFTDKVLNEDLNKIAYTRGSIEKETLIISKGEIVEGNKYQVLESLKSEYESQIWNASNYNWILFAYTLLVSLALLMLLLFLRKYRLDVFENNTKVTFIFFNIFIQ